MGRNILVTGGTSGIGLAVARRFSAHGDSVIIIGRDQARVSHAAVSANARGMVCDVTSPDAVEELVDRLPSTIDAVVAMAGGNTDIGRPSDDSGSSLGSTADAWDANLRVNTIGTVLVVTAVTPRLREGGSVITVSSIGAEYASTSYGASKAAVAAWTAGVSAQLGSRGITANCIAPGYIEDTNFFAGSLTDERRTALIEATHTRRAGTPADVAGLAFFLAGPDARQITGQTIHLNGGAHTTR